MSLCCAALVLNANVDSFSSQAEGPELHALCLPASGARASRCHRSGRPPVVLAGCPCHAGVVPAGPAWFSWCIRRRLALRSEGCGLPAACSPSFPPSSLLGLAGSSRVRWQMRRMLCHCHFCLCHCSLSALSEFSF